MTRLSLAKRVFLFTSVPLSLLLLGIFLAVNAVVNSQLRREVRDQLEESDRLLEQANSQELRRMADLASKLADTTGLKAALGLINEVGSDRDLQRQAQQTIEQQLQELESSTN